MTDKNKEEVQFPAEAAQPETGAECISTEEEQPLALTELEQKTKEAAENYEKYVRLYAEFDNYKKRVAKERTDLLKYGNEKIIKDILPVVDSIERALHHVSSAEDVTAVIEGLQLIYEKMIGTLQKHGVESIDALGKDFDPNFHEALGQVERDDCEDNKIVEEYEKGYLLNGRLLRPAKVSIARHVTR